MKMKPSKKDYESLVSEIGKVVTEARFCEAANNAK
jgi:hypothetical protein